jgi:hypothetical protein
VSKYNRATKFVVYSIPLEYFVCVCVTDTKLRNNVNNHAIIRNYTTPTAINQG